MKDKDLTIKKLEDIKVKPSGNKIIQYNGKKKTDLKRT